MKGYQGIGDITDSSLKDVNVSTQIEESTLNLIKNDIAPLLEKMEDKIEKIEKLDLGKRISEIEELDLGKRIRKIEESDLETKIKGLRKCGWVLLIIIIVIAVLSVLALCMALPAFSADSMSFLGWTVAVLSMLVVVLMGWHIFSVLDLKEYRTALRDIGVLNNSIDKIEGCVDISEKKINSYHQKYLQIVRAMSEYEQGLFAIYSGGDIEDDGKSGNLNFSFVMYMCALKILNQVGEDEITDIVIQAIYKLKNIDEAQKGAKKRISLSGMDKIKSTRILHESNHKLSDDLIEWIKSQPESIYGTYIEQYKYSKSW
jgi:hypothetical protein